MYIAKENIRRLYDGNTNGFRRCKFIAEQILIFKSHVNGVVLCGQGRCRFQMNGLSCRVTGDRDPASDRGNYWDQ